MTLFVARHPPDGLPFVLRLKRGRMYLMTLAGGVVGIAVANVLVSGGQRWPDPFPAAGALIGVVIGCAVGQVFWPRVLLAADQHGIWVRLPEHRPRVAWLPWTEIGSVAVSRRWHTGRYLAILPRTAGTGEGLGMDRAMRRRWRRFGAPFLAPLWVCGRSATGALAALRELAPGVVADRVTPDR